MTQISAALRGNTLVLKSEGLALEHQPDAFGVYRLIDTFNNRPAYKQDEGENFIYYNGGSKSWMVGTRIGHNYGWARVPNNTSHWAPFNGWEYFTSDRKIYESNDRTLRLEALTDAEEADSSIQIIREKELTKNESIEKN